MSKNRILSAAYCALTHSQNGSDRRLQIGEIMSSCFFICCIDCVNRGCSLFLQDDFVARLTGVQQCFLKNPQPFFQLFIKVGMHECPLCL